MSFANVNVGTSNSDNTGDSLRAAFQKINQNFAEITAGNIDITVDSAVTSVAGKTGDVVLYASDINGLTVAAVAEAASRGYVDTSRAQAEAASRAYTDIQIGQAVSGILDSAPGALDTLNELAAALGDDSNFAATITNRIAIVEDNLETIRLESSGSLSAAIDNLSDDINNEVARATAAEAELTTDISGLRTDLDSEAEDRALGDSTLQSNLETAVSDLEASDLSLDAKIDTEITNRTNAVNAVAGDLSAETQARIDSDTDLQTQINNIVSNIDPAALDSLTEIVDAFQAGDGSLTATVGNLQTSLSASIAAVQSNLDDEEAARIAADNQLGSDLMTEAAARVDADSDLQGQIDAEATARQTRDSELETGIDNVAGSVTALASRVTAVETDKANITYVDSAIAAIPPADFTGYATETYVDNAVADLVNSAPGTLDTLNELAAALGDDANFSTTITNLVANVQANVDTISDVLDTKANVTDLTNATDWNTAYGWGDHSQAGYVKSVGGELPNASGDVTVSKDSVVTALQYAPVSSVNGVVPAPSTGALVLDLADLTDATNLIPTVPTVVSQLDNDAGYITASDVTVDTGDFTFDTNTLGVTGGEMVLDGRVGIKQANPGLALHIGGINDSAPSEIGIAVSFGNDNISGAASLQWDWNDGAGVGSNSSDTTEHARFGIFKNDVLSHPWLTFDQDAPAGVLAVDSQGRLTATNGTGIDTESSGTSYSDTNFKIFDPWGTLFVTNKSMSSNGSGTTSITDVAHSFFAEASLAENLTRYDRIRGFSSSLDVMLNGYQWDAWYKFPTVAGATQSIKVIGSGTISQSIGNASYSIINATDGSLNVADTTDAQFEDYDSGTSIGVLGGSQLIVTDPNGAGSTVDVAAGLSAAIYVDNSGAAGSATVINAVGLYLPYRSNASNSWARTNGTATITNRFSIHSEDPNAILRNYGNIETNGAIVFNGGAVTFTGDISDLTDNSGLLSGGGGGTTLPADASGYLNNDGAGTLSWVPGNPGGSGLLPYNAVTVVSNTTTADWTEFTLTGTMDGMWDYNNSIASITLSSATAYGKTLTPNTKNMWVIDAKVNSNDYLVIEFPANPTPGDVFSVTPIVITQTVNAGSFVVGDTYTITSVGNTDWMSIGAQYSGAGQSFVATGAGSGTGIATTPVGAKKLILKPATGQRARTMSTGINGPVAFGQGGTYDFMFLDLAGQNVNSPMTWAYAGLIDSIPTWYHTYF
jgi:hypothetical protein